MTVNQMMTLSHVLLGFMIFFFAAAILVFFLLDVRKAWRILTGKKLPASGRRKEMQDRVTQKINTNNLLREEMLTKKIAMQSVGITEMLKKQESINNQYKGYDVTTVLKDREGETTLLISQDENDSKDDIVMDITFIHTEVTL